MKFLKELGILQIFAIAFLLIFLAFCPKLFDKVFPNNKSSRRIDGDFKSWLKQNNNKLYYVVKKVKCTENSIEQYVNFYLYLKVGETLTFVDVTYYLNGFLSNKGINSTLFFKNKNNKLNGTWKLQDFNIVELSQLLNKACGEVNLIRIDEDVVNC